MAELFRRHLGTTNPSGAGTPEAVYSFDGTADALLDRTGNGHDLSASVGSVAPEDYVSTCDLVGLYFDGGLVLIAPDSDTLRVTTAITVEIIFRRENNQYLYSCMNDSELETGNFLYSLATGHPSDHPEIPNTRFNHWFAFQEKGAGVNILSEYEDLGLYDTVEMITWTQDSAGTRKRLYHNGVFKQEITGDAPTKSGGTNLQRLRIGGDGATRSEYFCGTIYSVRITFQEFTSTQVHDGYEEALEERSDVEIESLFVVAKNLLKVIFNGNVATTPSLRVASNYSITPLDNLGDIAVKEILVPSLTQYTQEIYVVLSNHDFGREFRFSITCDRIFDVTGLLIPATYSDWTSHRTKVDSALDSLPNNYDKSSTGVLRKLLEAISISDEKIGGDF